MNHTHTKHGLPGTLAALAAAAAIAAVAVPAHAQPTSKAGAAQQPQGPRGLLTGKASPQIVQRRDGSQEIESDESMLHYSVAVRQPDGKIATYCVHGSEDARRLAAGEIKPSKAMEHSHDR